MFEKWCSLLPDEVCMTYLEADTQGLDCDASAWRTQANVFLCALQTFNLSQTEGMRNGTFWEFVNKPRSDWSKNVGSIWAVNLFFDELECVVYIDLLEWKSFFSLKTCNAPLGVPLLSWQKHTNNMTAGIEELWEMLCSMKWKRTWQHKQTCQKSSIIQGFVTCTLKNNNKKLFMSLSPKGP